MEGGGQGEAYTAIAPRQRTLMVVLGLIAAVEEISLEVRASGELRWCNARKTSSIAAPMTGSVVQRRRQIWLTKWGLRGVGGMVFEAQQKQGEQPSSSNMDAARMRRGEGPSNPMKSPSWGRAPDRKCRRETLRSMPARHIERWLSLWTPEVRMPHTVPLRGPGCTTGRPTLAEPVKSTGSAAIRALDRVSLSPASQPPAKRPHAAWCARAPDPPHCALIANCECAPLRVRSTLRLNPPKAHLLGKGASCPPHGEGGCPFEPGRVRGAHAGMCRGSHLSPAARICRDKCGHPMSGS